MKILWLSNYRFSTEPIKATGTWLRVMGFEVSKRQSIKLYNITYGKTNTVIHEDVCNIQQYVIPGGIFFSNKLPAKSTIKSIKSIIDDVKPDLIHIWGTEFFWASVIDYLDVETKVLLEIQGLNTQIKDQFFAGFTFFEVIKTIGIKEIIRFHTNPFIQYQSLKQSSQREISIIKSQSFISVQSEWSKSIVSLINRNAKLYRSLIPLREEIINQAGTWRNSSENILFVSASSPHIFKGIHILFHAVKVLMDSDIYINIRIAGSLSSGKVDSGYVTYLKKLLDKYSLQRNVTWLGAIEGEAIAKELKSASICVIPSYIESYCLALYEAICIGTPVVCSYAGAISEATKYNHLIKFFQPGDYFICAQNILELLVQKETFVPQNNLFISTSEAVDRQIDIYSDILKGI